MSIAKLLKAIEVVRTHDRDMPVQRLSTFLFIASQTGGVRRKDIQTLDQSPAAAARHLAALGQGTWQQNRQVRQALGWIEQSVDPLDSRSYVWGLTAQGRRIAQQLEDALS